MVLCQLQWFICFENPSVLILAELSVSVMKSIYTLDYGTTWQGLCRNSVQWLSREYILKAGDKAVLEGELLSLCTGHSPRHPGHVGRASSSSRPRRVRCMVLWQQLDGEVRKGLGTTLQVTAANLVWPAPCPGCGQQELARTSLLLKLP